MTLRFPVLPALPDQVIDDLGGDEARSQCAGCQSASWSESFNTLEAVQHAGAGR